MAARLRSSLFSALCALSALGCAPEEEDTSGIKVGALLPFTGELAAYGAAYERALILAVETVNDAGGVAGHKVRLVARDTHSETERGVASGRELLDMGVVNLIGPEEPEVTLRMAPLLAESDSTQILPSSSSPRPSGRTPDANWFHIAPGPRLLGCMLGTRLYLDGRARVVIINENDPFLFELASNVSRHYNDLLKPGVDSHRSTATVLPFQPNQQSYSGLIRSITSRDADALVLLGYPESGSKIVAAWDVGGDGAPIYLSPTLQSAAFRLNSPPGALEGSLGISVDVPDGGKAFAKKFAARWEGEQPMPMAYFYYDALILWALAFQAAYTEIGELPPSTLVQEQLVKVSKEGPNPVNWNEVKKGLALVAAGEGIDYGGASGELDLGDDGELAIGSSATFWRIRGEQVVEDTPGVCAASTH
jgi:branched-chain amino acid transport system substrate-binding protein